MSSPARPPRRLTEVQRATCDLKRIRSGCKADCVQHISIPGKLFFEESSSSPRTKSHFSITLAIAVAISPGIA
jgi:hypothetical protein